MISYTVGEVSLLISAIVTGLIAIIGAVFSGIAMVRSGHSAKVSRENSVSIKENTRVTQDARNDVVGHVQSVALAVNGQVEKALSDAKKASFAEGALDQRTKDDAVAEGRALGREEGIAKEKEQVGKSNI